MNEGDPFRRSGFRAHVRANDELLRQKSAELPNILDLIVGGGVIVGSISVAAYWVINNPAQAKVLLDNFLSHFR